MSTWNKTRQRHLTIIHDQQEVPKTLHITENSKTGASVDFAIHRTCAPTRVCRGEGDDSASCYALRGFLAYPNAVALQAKNQLLVESLETAPPAEVRRVADALWGALPRGRSWLRWNGAGDLTPGACRVINSLTRRRPELTLWVISRKPKMVLMLKDRKNLRVLLSLDHSTPAKIARRLRAVALGFQVGRARLAYTRVSEADIPPDDVYVVFNKHTGPKRNAWPHPSVCPATLPDVEHRGACESCRWCFT